LIQSDTFNRQDVLDSILIENPNYKTKLFDWHFSKLLSANLLDKVGKNLYIKSDPATIRNIYSYTSQSEVFATVESLLSSEYPFGEFIIWESIALNEFVNHQIAMNTIFVMTDKMVMESFFELLKNSFPSVLISPTPANFMRYSQNNSIIIEKLSSRYPKNPKQIHRCSIEKLIVDLFAERTISSIVSKGDYPAALETIFERYKVNETKLFNYARMRYVEKEIRTMIKENTTIRLYTDMEVDRQC